MTCDYLLKKKFITFENHSVVLTINEYALSSTVFLLHIHQWHGLHDSNYQLSPNLCPPLPQSCPLVGRAGSEGAFALPGAVHTLFP